MDEAIWRKLRSKPGFDWFIEARRYLQAAEMLRVSTEYRQGLIMSPPLHLLAHGSELLLKANLIASGSTVKEVRSFSHDIWKLWNDNRNEPLRGAVLSAVEEEWVAAKRNPAWLDGFSEDSAVLFEEYFKRLSELHTSETENALRYVRPDGTKVPKPHLLGPSMYRVADQYVRNMQQEIGI